MTDSWVISLSSLELGGYKGGPYLPFETETDLHVMTSF